MGMGMNLRGKLDQNDEFQGYQQVDDKTVNVGVIVTIQVLKKEDNEKGEHQIIKIKEKSKKYGEKYGKSQKENVSRRRKWQQSQRSEAVSQAQSQKYLVRWSVT